jgi:hypothetical protein
MITTETQRRNSKFFNDHDELASLIFVLRLSLFQLSSFFISDHMKNPPPPTQSFPSGGKDGKTNKNTESSKETRGS